MPQAKALRLKNKKPTKPHIHMHRVEGSADAAPAVKANKPIEIDDPELLVGTLAVLEEKTDDGTVVSGEEGEVAADEASLDDDEVDPFGDKWEQ